MPYFCAASLSTYKQVNIAELFSGLCKRNLARNILEDLLRKTSTHSVALIKIIRIWGLRQCLNQKLNELLNRAVNFTSGLAFYCFSKCMFFFILSPLAFDKIQQSSIARQMNHYLYMRLRPM